MADGVYSSSYSFLLSPMSETQDTVILTWHRSSWELLTEVGMCPQTSHFALRSQGVDESVEIHSCSLHLRNTSSDGIILRGEREMKTPSE